MGKNRSIISKTLLGPLLITFLLIAAPIVIAGSWRLIGETSESVQASPVENSPVTVSTSEEAAATGVGAQQKLVRLSDGTLYCIYPKQLAGQYQIYVKKSTNDGETWTDETRISTYDGMDDYAQGSSSIAVDSSNYLHVVWEGKATGYTTYPQIWYAKYTTSWTTPVRISTYSGMGDIWQYNPSIAVDSSDYLHVVWRGRATGYTTYYQIWYAKYITGWATPVRISTYSGMEGYSQYYASIAVNSSDNLHVVWYGKATGYTDYNQIWYAKYTTSWVAPVRISTYDGMDGQTQGIPSIAVDSSDNLHVVWYGKATGYTDYNQIWYAKYTTSWVAPVRISTYDGMDGQIQNIPSIAVDSSDYLHVVWQGMATGYTDYYKVWYAKYETSWATPECLQATGQNRYPNARWSRWPTSNQVTNRFDYVFTEGTVSPYNVMFDYITLVPPYAWQLVETWTGTIESPAQWNLIETWDGEVICQGWQFIETWTGFVSSEAWRQIETWHGWVYAPEWNLFETWTGIVYTAVPKIVVHTMTINLTENATTLTWFTFLSADNYIVQIDNDNIFASPFENTTSDNFYTHSLENYRTYWRVRGVDPGGSSGEWSNVFTFNLSLDVGVEPFDFDLVAAAMFLFPIVLMIIALAFDSVVFVFFAGTVFVFSGLYFIDTIWLAMIFIGIGIYLLVTALMSEED